RPCITVRISRLVLGPLRCVGIAPAGEVTVSDGARLAEELKLFNGGSCRPRTARVCERADGVLSAGLKPHPEGWGGASGCQAGQVRIPRRARRVSCSIASGVVRGVRGCRPSAGPQVRVHWRLVREALTQGVACALRWRALPGPREGLSPPLPF